MIAITKPYPGPAALETHGRPETAALCKRYEQGERDFESNHNIYANVSVKDTLIAAQHGKCCVIPERDDPATHIGWHREAPVPLTEQGRTTIEALRRGSNAWLALRRPLIAQLQRLLMLAHVAHLKAEVHAAEGLTQELHSMQAPTAPFSACVKAYLGKQSLP